MLKEDLDDNVKVLMNEKLTKKDMLLFSLQLHLHIPG